MMSSLQKRRACTRLFLLTVFVAFSTFSCSHLADALGLVPKKPQISFANFSVKQASFSKIETQVDLNVLNQDDKDLKVDSIVFDLLFSERIIGSGQSSQAIWIKPKEDQVAKFPIVLQTSELMGAAIQLMQGASNEHLAIRGSAEVNTWLGSVKIPFDHKLKPSSR
jgi:LEA14-like dessication related protein